MSIKIPTPWKVTVSVTFFIIYTGVSGENLSGASHTLYNQYEELEPLRIKGLWIVRESMVDSSEIETALTFAQANGFNHVFVQVRGRGDAFYNSLLVPKSPLVRDGRFDPLEYAVTRGHELGLNVHAWVTTYLLWSARTPPETGNHAYYMYPEWFEVDANGNAQRDIDLDAPRNGSFEGIYLSPIHPEVNGYLQAVFTEILLNYSIDGLHLDYCRFPDMDYGYNDEGLGIFEQRYGFDPRNTGQSQDNPEDGTGANQGPDGNLEIWSYYRRQQVTNLITALHAVITITGKEIMLTAAVKPNARVAYHKYYQDWLQWLRDGVLDYALIMNYTPDINEYIENVTIVSDSLSERFQSRVIMGVANYNQDATATAEKIQIARLYGYEGICIFSYDVFKTDLDRFKPIVDMLNK